ncbi:MAG: sterol desaturase family protein [Cytophagales bacterium]
MSWSQAVIVFFIENLIVWFLGLMFGRLLQKIFYHRRTTSLPLHIFSTHIALELKLSFWAILSNTCITLFGYQLWLLNILQIQSFQFRLMDFIEIFLLIFVIDLLMFLLHKLAHHPVLFHKVHSLHHKFTQPTSITLYSLHPLENLAFGLLILSVFTAYSFNWVAIIFYLTLNVVFGIIGHCGVEPIPDSWKHIFPLKYIANGKFHIDHHETPNTNYGFYTNIWDRLFKTTKF